MKEKLILVVKLIEKYISLLWNNLNFRLSFFSLVCALLGLLAHKLTILSLSLYILGYILLFFKILIKVIKRKQYREMFLQNVLVLFITLLTFILGYCLEAIIVLNFFYLSEILMKHLSSRLNVVFNSKKILTNLVIDNKTRKIAAKNIKTNDIIIVKQGEIIPVSGVIIDGRSLIDSYHITGRHDKCFVTVYDHVRSGWFNIDGILKIQVTEDFNHSALFQINRLLKSDENYKTPIEVIGIKLDLYYPLVLSLISLITFFIFGVLLKQDAKTWLYRLFVCLLVIQPGCFLRIVNLTYYSIFQKLIKKGIFIKSKQQLKDIDEIDTIIFDAPGTLTKNNYNIVKIVPNKDVEQKDLLEMLCYGVCYSSFTVYRDILRDTPIKINKILLSNYQEQDDKNIKVILNNRELIIGQSSYLIENSYRVKKIKDKRDIIHVGYDHEYLGYIIIGDQINNDSKVSIETLTKKDVDNIVLLSSNERSSMKDLAEQLAITDYQSSMSLEKKKEYVKRLKDSFQVKGKIAYVTTRNNIDDELTPADLNFVFEDSHQNLSLEDRREINITNDSPMTIANGIVIVKKMKMILIVHFAMWFLLPILLFVLGLFGIARLWHVMLVNILLNVFLITINLFYLKEQNLVYKKKNV
ncbi:MAG: HAD-IC family P-type ATPase [Bacilli bacterium]